VNSTPIDEGSLTHPASAMLASSDRYYPFINPSDTNRAGGTSSGDPLGYCLASTTDGSTLTP
jgi:hypothetical protein